MISTPATFVTLFSLSLFYLLRNPTPSSSLLSTSLSSTFHAVGFTSLASTPNRKTTTQINNSQDSNTICKNKHDTIFDLLRLQCQDKFFVFSTISSTSFAQFLKILSFLSYQIIQIDACQINQNPIHEKFIDIFFLLNMFLIPIKLGFRVQSLQKIYSLLVTICILQELFWRTKNI